MALRRLLVSCSLHMMALAIAEPAGHVTITTWIVLGKCSGGAEGWKGMP